MLFGRHTSKQIGDTAEEKAVTYLLKAGLKIIERNYRAKTGEIDIIAKDKDAVVFVEVKFRRNSSFGQPYESVTYQKQQKIIRTAQYFLQKNRKHSNKSCRFDIISILDNEITWLKNAFS